MVVTAGKNRQDMGQECRVVYKAMLLLLSKLQTPNVPHPPADASDRDIA